MPATNDITGHILLSADATALGDALGEYTLGAEQLLGLHGRTFTGDDLADAKSAIARQVNRILEWEDRQGVISISQGNQRTDYGEAGPPPIDRVAESIAARLLGRRAPTAPHVSAAVRTRPRF